MKLNESRSMRSFFARPLALHLSPTSVRLVRSANRWKDLSAPEIVSTTVLDEMNSGALLAPELNRLFETANTPGSIISITLGDDWVRYFLVTPPTNCTSADDCKAAAVMRFQSLYGESANHWRFQADWHAYIPFIACTIPNWVVENLEQSATNHRLKLIAIIPKFVSHWNQHWRTVVPDAWFGVIDRHVLTIGICEGNRLLAVRTTPMPLHARHQQSWLIEHIRRHALTMHRSMPAQVQLSGDIPKAWIGNSPLICSSVDDLPNKGISRRWNLRRYFRNRNVP
jgi:hypothetical protein